MQDRGFDLQVPPLVQKPPQLAHDEASLHEYIAHFAIHNQIDVTLPVPDFDILQAVPFLRQRQETFRQKRDLACQHGQLARARAKQRAFDSDEIADIEQFVQLKVPIRKQVLPRVNLKLALAIRKRDESGLAERTIREDPPGNADLDFAMLQVFGGFLRELLDDFLQRVRVPVIRRIGVVAEFLNLLQLLDADLFKWFHVPGKKPEA